MIILTSVAYGCSICRSSLSDTGRIKGTPSGLPCCMNKVITSIFEPRMLKISFPRKSYTLIIIRNELYQAEHSFATSSSYKADTHGIEPLGFHFG